MIDTGSEGLWWKWIESLETFKQIETTQL